jgi:lactate dehydrogenase-like 2-hydroxyacid dehydrogenase
MQITPKPRLRLGGFVPFWGMSSERPHLLILAPFPDFLRAPLEESYVCHSASDLGSPAGIRAVSGAGGTTYDEALLRTLPNLEIISVFGVGYDGVPLAYCKARGIRVTNTPDVLTEDVADIALALVLMTARQLVAANRYLHAGSWQRAQFGLATKPGGKRAGIFGLGRIGKAIACRLQSIGMEIGYHGRHPQRDVSHPFFPSLIELAEWCDFLIVSSPGGAATRNLVNAEVLRALGPEGTLINIARGSVVDEPALIQALQTGVIKAAGLDVFAHEPNVPAELLALENAVLFPHVGSGTIETRRAMASLVVENLKAHFAGQPLLTPIPELA